MEQDLFAIDFNSYPHALFFQNNDRQWTGVNFGWNKFVKIIIEALYTHTAQCFHKVTVILAALQICFISTWNA